MISSGKRPLAHLFAGSYEVLAMTYVRTSDGKTASSG